MIILRLKEMTKFQIDSREYTISFVDKETIEIVCAILKKEYKCLIDSKIYSTYKMIDNVQTLYSFLTDCFNEKSNDFQISITDKEIIISAKIETKYACESYKFVLEETTTGETFIYQDGKWTIDEDIDEIKIKMNEMIVNQKELNDKLVNEKKINMKLMVEMQEDVDEMMKNLNKKLNDKMAKKLKKYDKTILSDKIAKEFKKYDAINASKNDDVVEHRMNKMDDRMNKMDDRMNKMDDRMNQWEDFMKRIGFFLPENNIIEIEKDKINHSSINVALAANGGMASACDEIYSPASTIINGNRTGEKSSLRWWSIEKNDCWVQILFNGLKTIDRVIIYTLQDNYDLAIEPTDTLTFKNFGVTDFQIQGWNGIEWKNLGEPVHENNLVKRTVKFTAFETSKIRINLTNKQYNRAAHLVEVEAWTPSITF